MKQKFFIIHQYGSLVVTWLQSRINAVPCKVSSCGVYEVSRQGIEWLGNSFGCMKVAWGLAHNSLGKSSHPQHPYFFHQPIFLCLATIL